ncbi:hypothetical protein HK098_001031 [Nowakowskiella sp. JEL0407]|nr:hypothetical protein HK098_001031 [Nowakowskiella sp. JEL0407]
MNFWDSQNPSEQSDLSWLTSDFTFDSTVIDPSFATANSPDASAIASPLSFLTPELATIPKENSAAAKAFADALLGLPYTIPPAAAPPLPNLTHQPLGGLQLPNEFSWQLSTLQMPVFTGNVTPSGSPSPVIPATSAKTTKKTVAEKPEKEMTPEEKDKRQRNTAASARFRAKKKLREQAMERNAKELNVRVEELEGKLLAYEMEIKWLRNIVADRESPKRLREIYEENGLNFTEASETPLPATQVRNTPIPLKPLIPSEDVSNKRMRI